MSQDGEGGERVNAKSTELLTELLETTTEYIDLLHEELAETAQIASVHGWKSSRHLQGVKIRVKIDELKRKIKGVE